MTSEVVAWILALLGAMGLAALWPASRRNAARAEEAERDRTGLRGQLERTRTQLAQRAEAHRKRGEELAELRRKLDKAKKRVRSSLEEQSVEPDRTAKLEEQLGTARQALASAREELAEAHAARAEAEREIAHLRARAEEVRPTAPRVDPELEARRRNEREQLESRMERLETERNDAQQQSARHRKRWDALNKAYLVLRGENELRKDQLHQQERELERLRALKVALIDPVPAESAGDRSSTPPSNGGDPSV